MVAYSDLFEFCILMVTVIGLVIKVCNIKKSNRPASQTSGYFFS